jgi:hypothetical protein
MYAVRKRWEAIENTTVRQEKRKTTEELRDTGTVQ